jgi:hypothetical protein
MAEQVIPLIDGTRTVKEVADAAIGSGVPAGSRAAVIRELANLYWYGACNLHKSADDGEMIAALRGGEPTPLGIPQIG